MPIQVAETTKARKARKVLAHLEVHPQLGGGHLVRHVYAGFGHEPKEVSFNKDGKSQGGEHIVNHLVKHGGLPGGEPGSPTQEMVEEGETQ